MGFDIKKWIAEHAAYSANKFADLVKLDANSRTLLAVMLSEEFERVAASAIEAKSGVGEKAVEVARRIVSAFRERETSMQVELHLSFMFSGEEMATLKVETVAPGAISLLYDLADDMQLEERVHGVDAVFIFDGFKIKTRANVFEVERLLRESKSK